MRNDQSTRFAMKPDSYVKKRHIRVTYFVTDTHWSKQALLILQNTNQAQVF